MRGLRKLPGSCGVHKRACRELHSGSSVGILVLVLYGPSKQP
jgi:hypothetical protein